MSTSFLSMPLIPIPGFSNPNSDRHDTTGGFSSASSSRKKKKNSQRIFSLEEVYNQILNVNTSSLNVPMGKLVLTPRSAEACSKLGVNPEILKARDLDSFWESGSGDPDLQAMRHEAYMQRRQETMKKCRIELKRITNAIFEAPTVEEMANEEIFKSGLVLQNQKNQSLSLIQLETSKIAKIQQRQEKELGQMIQHEISRARLQEEMNNRLTDQKRRDEETKRQTDKRNKLAGEERRLKDMQKASLLEIEEDNRRALAKIMNDKDKVLFEQRAKKDSDQRRRMIAEESERAKRSEDHKAQVQKYFAAEQARLRERLENMNFKERIKQEALLVKQKEHAEQIRERRDRVERRIEMNMSMVDRIDEKRKTDFMEKQEHFERIRETHMQQQEQERVMHAQEVALQDQRRQMILAQQRIDEDRAAQRLLGKLDDNDDHVQALQEVRDREQMLIKEKKNLRVQIKLENLERVQRQGEYKKSLTLKKIESCESRVKSMLEQRRILTSERKKASATLRLQKENVCKIMEVVRSDASKASRIISLAISGKLPLKDLASGNLALRGASADNTKKRKGSKSKRSLSLNNMDPDRSVKSAGEEPDYSFEEFDNIEEDDGDDGAGGNGDADGDGDGPGSTEEKAADASLETSPSPTVTPFEIPILL